METKCRPDLSTRPHTTTVEHQMRASAAAIYEAWTEKFDLWFAQPGELMMRPEIDRPYFFYNRHDWGRHAHYGRFTRLEKDRLVEMTWVTPHPGTAGAETLLRVELDPNAGGTRLLMAHSGFDTEEAAAGHKENWPLALQELDDVLSPRP